MAGARAICGEQERSGGDIRQKRVIQLYARRRLERVRQFKIVAFSSFAGIDGVEQIDVRVILLENVTAVFHLGYIHAGDERVVEHVPQSRYSARKAWNEALHQCAGFVDVDTVDLHLRRIAVFEIISLAGVFPCAAAEYA